MQRGHVCIWKIENFIQSGSVHLGELVSPVFTIEIDRLYTEWCLRINTQLFLGQLSCYVKRLDDERAEKIGVNLEISIVTANGNIVSSKAKNHDKFGSPGDGLINTWNWREMMKEKSVYFPDDSFTVRCRLWPRSLQMETFIEYFAVTHFERKRIVCQKSIRCFEAFFSNYRDECLLLSLNNNYKITFHGKNYSEYFSLKFPVEDSFEGKPAKLFCKLRVLDSGGIPLYSTEKFLIKELERDGFPREGIFPDVVHISELRSFRYATESKKNNLVEVTLEMEITCSRIVQMKSLLPRAVAENDKHAHDSLNQGFGAFYFKETTDLQLRSGGETLSAHKAILCAKSPVFAAMLSKKISEKESGVIHIDDVDAVTLDKLLLYLYTGIVDDLDEKKAKDLLCAASKYKVVPLKDKCVAYLNGAISVRNACRMLRFADACHEESLKKAVLDFICSHHRDILATDEWRQLGKEHFALANEVFVKLSAKFPNYR